MSTTVTQIFYTETIEEAERRKLLEEQLKKYNITDSHNLYNSDILGFTGKLKDWKKYFGEDFNDQEKKSIKLNTKNLQKLVETNSTMKLMDHCAEVGDNVLFISNQGLEIIQESIEEEKQKILEKNNQQENLIDTTANVINNCIEEKQAEYVDWKTLDLNSCRQMGETKQEVGDKVVQAYFKVFKSIYNFSSPSEIPMEHLEEMRRWANKRAFLPVNLSLKKLQDTIPNINDTSVLQQILKDIFKITMLVEKDGSNSVRIFGLSSEQKKGELVDKITEYLKQKN